MCRRDQRSAMTPEGICKVKAVADQAIRATEICTGVRPASTNITA